MSLILENLTFGYSTDQPVLHNLSLSMADGEFVLLMGQNGAGKSTLLKLLNGILKPTAGWVTVNGLDTRQVPTHALASHIAVTFQNPADQIFASTVAAEIAYGAKTLRRQSPAQLAESAARLLGLEQNLSRHPYDLSLAHRKLLTVASAVAMDSPILAFDEPSASLSQPERLVLLRALESLRQSGKTLLIVSHDLDLFIPVMSRIVVLAGGTILHDGRSEDFLREPRLARSVALTVPLVLRLQMHIARENQS
jgi:energy-coupling factor transport system ATP-binding protein